MAARRVDLGLLGHSVTLKGAFPLTLGVGTGLWVLEVLTCVYSQRMGGRVHVQELTELSTAQTADLHEIRVFK